MPEKIILKCVIAPDGRPEWRILHECPNIMFVEALILLADLLAESLDNNDVSVVIKGPH